MKSIDQEKGASILIGVKRLIDLRMLTDQIVAEAY